MTTGHELSGLMKFAARSEWRDPLDEAMGDRPTT